MPDHRAISREPVIRIRYNCSSLWNLSVDKGIQVQQFKPRPGVVVATAPAGTNADVSIQKHVVKITANPSVGKPRWYLCLAPNIAIYAKGKDTEYEIKTDAAESSIVALFDADVDGRIAFLLSRDPPKVPEKVLPGDLGPIAQKPKT